MKCFFNWAFVAFVFFCFSNSALAQEKIQNPVTWTYSQQQINDSEFVLGIHAKINKDWHVYTQKLPVSAIQNPTQFTYNDSNKYFTIEGATMELSKVITLRDTTSLKDTETFFIDSANYSQKILVHNKKGFTLKGNVYYQTCNSSMCLPPKEVDFSFTIPPVSNKKTEGSGYWGIFFLGLGIGLAALFTPCVFPMIPLTVSFFLKRNSSKKKGMRDAITYGLCIVFIYVALGGIITAIFGPSGLNAIASNGWVNLFFFLIFVVFGISLLGAFEITLPSSWGNKADSASEKGGVMGIFFMALTLCLVSFSCTGPFLGSLLAGAATSNAYWSLVIGMFGFSFALALPFVLFAIFPSWLKNLPQSGGWLNSVKVVFGLFELAFSLKFLSTADLVGLHIKFLHLHINGPMGILKREIFIALWVVIFIIIGLYLIGKIKFSHDSELKYISAGRVILAVISFSFSLYLLPGMFGAPLKLIGGFPPPLQYNEGWTLGGNGNSDGNTVVSNSNASVKHSKNDVNAIGCPLNLNCFHDYDEAVAYAKEVNKPIMIDFTGFACVNCRKMEQNVWSDPKVLPIIRNDYVLVSLYVDDPTELPTDKQNVSKTTGQKIETSGDKWSDMETSLFQSNTQPLYALVDKDGKLLVPTRGGYIPDIDEYAKFLEEGKSNYSKAVK